MGAYGVMAVAGILLLALLVRVLVFLDTTTGGLNPLPLIQSQVAPAPGSIAWKLHNGQRVNILLLGRGGAENDSPDLTDTILVATLDPATKRVALLSVPRDIWLPIDATGHSQFEDKINVAYAVGTGAVKTDGKPLPEFTGPDGPGHLAEKVVSQVTGVQFDAFATVDFVAFRKVVNTLGGVDICLDTPLDDNQYPDYHNGYVPGGIHFRAGCQHVNGEQALELARSRHATEPEQATDFGRARRQQQLIDAIRKKVASAGGITQLLPLMSALQGNVRTDLKVGDITAIYQWSRQNVTTSHLALTNVDFLHEYYEQRGSCGPLDAYVLCPIDPSWGMVHQFVAADLVDRKVSAEKAPVTLATAAPDAEMAPRLSVALKQLGFDVGQPDYYRYAAKTVIYDYSGGKYPATARWLADYFRADVVTAQPSAGSDGLVVPLGYDFYRRWIGNA
jgi:LCP family protein required for cell wall assembly